MAKGPHFGRLAGLFAGGAGWGQPLVARPPTTALGALLSHITGSADARTFQPMNVNFGLFPELPMPAELGKAEQRAWRAERKPKPARRAAEDLATWQARSRLTAARTLAVAPQCALPPP